MEQYNFEFNKDNQGSYKRQCKVWHTTYADICTITSNKKTTIEWCQNKCLLGKEYFCPKCFQPMDLVISTSKNVSSDAVVWRCRRRIMKVRHQVERSIRKGTWFENSNLTLEEILKLTYLWTQNVAQQHVSSSAKSIYLHVSHVFFV